MCMSRNPFIYINSRDSRLCVTLPRGPSRVRTAGARGERSPRIVVGRGREEGRGIGREREGSRDSYDRSREIERSDPRDGRGDLEGSLEMIDTRTV